MHPHRILILYGTKYGQTAKITSRVTELLEKNGDIVTHLDARELSHDVRLDAYDGVIIGGSIIRGRHQPSVRDYVSNHYLILNGMPSAFLSVSGSAASPDERGRADARRCAEEFLRVTHWRPAIVETVGGAMAFTQYGPLLRWLMKQISKRSGGPTDTTRDHELTDWSQVQRFVDQFRDIVDQALLVRALGMSAPGVFHARG